MSHKLRDSMRGMHDISQSKPGLKKKGNVLKHCFMVLIRSHLFKNKIAIGYKFEQKNIPFFHF